MNTYYTSHAANNKGAEQSLYGLICTFIVGIEQKQGFDAPPIFNGVVGGHVIAAYSNILVHTVHTYIPSLKMTFFHPIAAGTFLVSFYSLFCLYFAGEDY